jgi:Fic family protein
MLLLTDKYFSDYQLELNRDLSDALPIGQTPIFAPDSFSFYTSVAAVYSSKIEGEDIEADSYVKHRFMGVKFKPNYTKKTDDLFKAYEFARHKKLTSTHLLKAHTILSKNILHTAQRGTIRLGVVQVQDEEGRILYVGTHPNNVKRELNKLMDDINVLLSEELTANQCFYYASLIHLLFLNIHPFNDGNGRTSRLLEKWFLAQKLGERAWNMPSERHYYRNLTNYYHNLQRLGWEYETLNYDRCLPFLLMLPQSLMPN